MAGLLVVCVMQMLPTPVNLISRALSHKPNQSTGHFVLTTFKAAFVGLSLPLCSCGVLPLAISLKKSGVPVSQTVALVTAAQAAGLDSFVITVGVLGWRAAWLRLLGAVMISTAAGFAVYKASNHCESATKSERQSKKNTSHTAAVSSVSATLWNLAKVLANDFEEVAPWIFLGAMITSFATNFVKPYASHSNEILSVLPSFVVAPVSRALLFIAILPLQMCEHATVSLAKAFAAAGGMFSTGTAFAFLILCPATNLATLGALLGNSKHSAVMWVAAAFVLTGLFVSFFLDAFPMVLGSQGLQAVAGGAEVMPRWFPEVALKAAGLLTVVAVGRKLGVDLLDREKDDCCSDCNDHDDHSSSSTSVATSPAASTTVPTTPTVRRRMVSTAGARRSASRSRTPKSSSKKRAAAAAGSSRKKSTRKASAKKASPPARPRSTRRSSRKKRA
jgi:uncharacterized membrane protein YraQ (UPF0718 family)